MSFFRATAHKELIDARGRLPATRVAARTINHLVGRRGWVRCGRPTERSLWFLKVAKGLVTDLSKKKC